jgi:toxin ParE1/3/4
MADFKITPRAREDLIGIGRFTARKWGQKQCTLYLKNLDARFQWLADHPGRGKHRTDVQEGYHCFPQGSHLIFYIVRDYGIDIIGIPHQSMDVLNYFHPHEQ